MYKEGFFLINYLFTIQTLTLLMLLTIPYHTYITNNTITYTYNTKYLICFYYYYYYYCPRRVLAQRPKPEEAL